MNISSGDSDAANTAITNLQAALTSYGAISGPAAKDLFARDTLLPLNAGAIALAASLGRTLRDETVSNASTAVQPFTANTVELSRIVGELGAVRQLRALVHGLESAPQLPSEAPGVARLIVTTLQAVLAVAVVA
ncbi:MAG: hypothetical protein WDN28_15455 [Chthoniobacter sp.]